MKMPNGYGSITKLKGARRKPYMVRARCCYTEKDGKKCENRKLIGCYATKAEALKALAEHNRKPVDTDIMNISLDEVYNRFLEQTKLSETTLKAYKCVYGYFSGIKKMRFREINLSHIQPIVSGLKVSMQIKAKSLLHNLYILAMRYDIAEKDYSELVEIAEKKQHKEKTPFTEDEIHTIYNSEGLTRDILMVLIYSGWRISELLGLKTENIDLQNKTMCGGLKTKAGKNRIVPIHPTVMPIIARYYNENNATLFDTNYKSIYYSIKRKTGHTPHETRHTFITMLRRYGADELCIKRIVGHRSYDVTEDVYMHISVDELRSNINLIPESF